MRIGELSARTGVSRRMLRYYEAQGLLRPGRERSGYRDYGEDDVDRLRLVERLRAAGLSLGAIRTIRPCLDDETLRLTPCPEVVARLRRELRRLDARIEELTRHRDGFEGLLARFFPEEAARDEVRRGRPAE